MKHLSQRTLVQTHFVQKVLSKLLILTTGGVNSLMAHPASTVPSRGMSREISSSSNSIEISAPTAAPLRYLSTACIIENS